MRALLAAVLVLGGCGADATTSTRPPDMRVPLGTCMNGLTDDDETDQDCGGACMPCDEGKACKGAKDCVSGICANRVCAAPACDDTVQNGTESDKDCGGTCPTKCAEGQKCNDGTDCTSANCVNNACATSLCANGKLDNGETDVDCGGPNCTTRCPGGRMCSDGPDCGSGMCINNVCKSACPDGTEDCDGDAANGCEVATDSDGKNCGGCGQACPANMPACVGGACRAQCVLAFAPHVDYPVGTWPYSLRMVDLNGDKKPDLATVNSKTNNLSVLLNTGNGTFAAAVNYPAGRSGNVSLNVGDMNGDGKPDLIVAASSIFVFLNNGNGTFAMPIETQIPNGVTTFAVADLDGDGKLDVAGAATNSSPTPVSIAFGAGNGSFGAATMFSLGKVGGSIAAGDLNGDGKPDLAISEPNDGHVHLRWNDGKGGFGSSADLNVDSGPGYVAIADLNGDGKRDLAVAVISNPSAAVLLNTGKGTFAPPVSYRTQMASPLSLTIGDLNLDGKPDIVVPGLGARGVTWFLNAGNGTFGAASTIDLGPNSEPNVAAIGDVNGDGRPDLALSELGPSSVSILLNQCK